MKQNQQQTIVRILILEVSKFFEAFPSVAWSLRKLSLSVWRLILSSLTLCTNKFYNTMHEIYYKCYKTLRKGGIINLKKCMCETEDKTYPDLPLQTFIMNVPPVTAKYLK